MSCECTYECECQNICGKGRRRGATGATGATGFTGNTGNTGNTGEAGVSGPPGCLKFSGVLAGLDANGFLADNGNGPATLPANKLFVYPLLQPVKLTSLVALVSGLVNNQSFNFLIRDVMGNFLYNQPVSADGLVSVVLPSIVTSTVGLEVQFTSANPPYNVNIQATIGYVL